MMIILLFLMILENNCVCILPSLLLTNPLVAQHLLTLERCVYRPKKFKGGDWYNINPPPRIIKQRDWALNEGNFVDECMFPFSLSSMGYGGVVVGGARN